MVGPSISLSGMKVFDATGHATRGAGKRATDCAKAMQLAMMSLNRLEERWGGAPPDADRHSLR